MSDGEKKELSFGDLKIILDFLEKSGEKTARLMGGEPALHSRFKELVDYILSRGFSVHIFTNGLFPQKITNFLANKGKLIKYSFNIDSRETYSFRDWNQISKNLKILSQFGRCLIGKVIWQEDFDIDYLLNLAKKYSIKVIMLRIANPIMGGENKYVSPGQYLTLAKSIIREVKKANKQKVKIGFGCGFSQKMFAKNQLAILKKYNVANLKWGCDGNSGRFDIDTALSIFRCFPLSGWKRKKLPDFKNTKEAENYFAKIMLRYQSRNSHIDFIRQGPCFACLLKNNL